MADDSSVESSSGNQRSSSDRMSFADKLLAAAGGQWGYGEQSSLMAILRAWMKMLEDEIREKQKTILEIFSRLDMHEEQIAQRVKSAEYQSLMKKAFRNWSGTESTKKQKYIRNILCNAAAATFVSDDVVSLFIEWLQTYSEFHFAVIGEIYKNPGSTRSEIWENLGKGEVREDSAEADLFRLLIHDLSTGRIIRQRRDTDNRGNFYAKQRARTTRRNTGPRMMKSAFDDNEDYFLTALGDQFVHYAMNELTTKITYEGGAAGEAEKPSSEAQ